MVTVFGEVVSVATKTAQEWVEGYELDGSGRCALKWGGEWHTIAKVRRDKWLVYFDFVADSNLPQGITYPLAQKVAIGFRACYVVCDKCKGENVSSWDSQPVYEFIAEEDGEYREVQTGERTFFVCHDCKHRFVEED